MGETDASLTVLQAHFRDQRPSSFPYGGGAMNRWIISFFIAHCYGTLSKAVSGSGLSWVVSRGFNAFVIH